MAKKIAKLQVEKGADNPVLRSQSDEVRTGGGIGNFKMPRSGMGISDFVKGMKKVLEGEKGLGLAAPQVGENVRIILCRMNAGSDNEMIFVMVNPEIIDQSWKGEALLEEDLEGESVPEGAEVAEEGCLSLPGTYVKVVRARDILVRFLDGRGLLKGGKSGREFPALTLQLRGLNARVVQHETDHLEGVMICDGLNMEKES
jgi:peptide deformylase